MRCFALTIVLLAAQAAPAQDLVRIPATSRNVVDGETGVSITVASGEFLISPTEITQAAFEQIMGYNPSLYKGPLRPVENVSWWEAIRYCNLRSIKEGLDPCYDLATGECDLSRNGYRLPSDAEWEAANGRRPQAKPDAIGRLANLGSADTKNTDLLIRAVNEKGTRDVASFPPNEFGLYDMLGNVWEWCNDYFNPAGSGPQIRGLARIIRGGSFISTVSGWARGYRSSMEPEYKSRFTGFRICRTAARTRPAGETADTWFEPYNRAPAGFETSTGRLSRLLQGITTLPEWQTKRQAIRAKWGTLLGAPSVAPPAPNVKLVATIPEQNYTGQLLYLQVEPDFWEKIYILRPYQTHARPVPVVIVPYYDVDTPAGKNLGGRSYMPPSVRSFAYLAAQQGYLAVAIRWFGESYGERYDEAVANLKMKYPGCTGLGKWAWDAQRLVDYLYSLPEVDRAHIGIIGHSLGAKMAMYAAAMDERITAVVASEGGIGLSFSNYDDYWYLGETIRRLDPATDHHELLALIAPRPFLLIGGDEFDTQNSWHYINAARQVYALFDKPRNIGYFNHHKGHTPTPEAVSRSIEWLQHFLGPVQ